MRSYSLLFVPLRVLELSTLVCYIIIIMLKMNQVLCKHHLSVAAPLRDVQARNSTGTSNNNRIRSLFNILQSTDVLKFGRCSTFQIRTYFYLFDIVKLNRTSKHRLARSGRHSKCPIQVQNAQYSQNWADCLNAR